MKAGWYRQGNNWLLYLWRGKGVKRVLTLIKTLHNSSTPDTQHVVRGRMPLQQLVSEPEFLAGLEQHGVGESEVGETLDRGGPLAHDPMAT